MYTGNVKYNLYVIERCHEADGTSQPYGAMSMDVLPKKNPGRL